jgi:hypothetical protein
MLLLRTLIFLLLAFLPITYCQASGSRIALVIGNSKYQHTDSLPELANPTHDAEDIAKVLRGFGFEVIERKNQTKEEMDAAIAEFGRKISNSEAALFYFAGHGLQMKSQNFLIPVDAAIESEAQVPYKSINVNQILDEIDNGKSQANIVMLDACRNNPISGKFRSGASRGLAAPTSQPKGTVIVYATDPGNTAADGDGRNGLFTAGLLTAFKGSDLSLHGVLTRASAEVERGSNKMQTPYVNGPMTLQENFYFLPNAKINVTAPDSKGSNIDPASIELSFWDSIKNSTNPDDFRAYLTKYPKGQFEALAHNRLNQPELSVERPVKSGIWDNIKDRVAALTHNQSEQPVHVKSGENIEQEAWNSISGSRDSDAIHAYLNQYPTGRFVSEANLLLASLKSPKSEKPIVPTSLPVTVKTETSPKPSVASCPDCPEMVLIPGGNFMMGFSATEQDHEQVLVNPFLLGKYEVTRQQFSAFVNDTGYSTQGNRA